MIQAVSNSNVAVPATGRGKESVFIAQVKCPNNHLSGGSMLLPFWLSSQMWSNDHSSPKAAHQLCSQYSCLVRPRSLRKLQKLDENGAVYRAGNIVFYEQSDLIKRDVVEWLFRMLLKTKNKANGFFSC